jgi:hypothetical protein
LLEDLSHIKKETKDAKDKTLKALSSLSPEVRSLFLQEIMPKFIRVIEKNEGYPIPRVEELLQSGDTYKVYTDIGVFWSELKNNPISHHFLLSTEHMGKALLRTKELLKQNVLAAFPTEVWL